MRPFKNNAGFTFIEVFLTLLILGICFVPVVRMFSSSISEIAYIDDMQTAINLGREEVEKMKNLALTEDQIKTLGNVASQPILLNTKYWRTLRIIKQEAKPLEFTVVVFKGDDLNHPLVGVSTIIQK